MVNVGPIGCIPQLFNTQLKSLVAELRTKLEGSLFVYADVYHIMEDILQNYNDYGGLQFTLAKHICCRFSIWSLYVKTY